MSRLESLARGSATGTVHRVIAFPSPAAGAALVIAPDSGRAWEVLSVLCLLTTDETDAERAGELVYAAGTTTAWLISGADTISADATGGLEWVADWSFSDRGDDAAPIATSMPHAILLPGYTLTVNILNIAPADQISGAVVQVLETGTGEREYARTIAGRLAGRAEAISDLLTEDY